MAGHRKVAVRGGMMATAAYELEKLQTASGAERRGRVAVIIDDGVTARVMPVAFAATPRIGDRFELDGRTWEIVRLQDSRRGFVAHPAALLR